MKKRFLGLIGLFGLLGIGAALPVRSVSVRAEDEQIVEPAKGTVTLIQGEHGSISADKAEGNVGDVIKLTVKADMFYLIGEVKANDTVLVESTTTKGEYTFSLVEGENKITAKFVVDSATLGTFTEMFEEAQNKDWKNLFSVKNVITIVSFVLNGGLLIAIIRYFVKDKKLEKKLEDKVGDVMATLVPEQTKQAVINSVTEVITPIFANSESKMIEIERAMGVFAKCMALSQENTPESRKAIIDELTGLKISDETTLGEVKAFIEATINKALAAKEETLKQIEELKNINSEIINKEEKHSEEEEKTHYDGTSI